MEKAEFTCPLDKIVMSNRTRDLLIKGGYSTLNEVAGVSNSELTKIGGLGKGALKEIRDLVRTFRPRVDNEEINTLSRLITQALFENRGIRHWEATKPEWAQFMDDAESALIALKRAGYVIVGPANE